MSAIPVAREEFDYARLDSGHVHAFETGRPHTLCGQAITQEWRPADYPLPPERKLCGVCDKVIRARIREAREAEVSATLRTAGQGEVWRLLEMMVMELSETYGLLVAIKDGAAYAMRDVHLNRMKLLRVLKGDGASEDGPDEQP